MTMESRNGSECHEVFFDVPRGKYYRKPTDDMGMLIELLKNGWDLFQNKYTFEWYVKKREPERPLVSLTGVVYKPTALALQKRGYLRLLEQDIKFKDWQYVLTKKGLEHGC